MPPTDPTSPSPPRDPSNRSAWERRIAAAEINGRRVNEAIERGRNGSKTPTFLCECGHIGCTTKLTLTIPEYEHVRTGFERFMLAPGHEIDGIDIVVERRDRFLVVEKHGQPGEMARRTDERTPSGDRD